MRHSTSIALACAALLAPIGRAQTISNGSYSVTLDRMGLLEQPPAGGLTSTYGPRVVFLPGAFEWFGVGYDAPGGRVQVVGEGKTKDPLRRTPVQFVSAAFTRSGATTIGRAGDLEIEHTFTFCEFTGCLVIGVVLRNTGRSTMSMVMYTREWMGNAIDGGTFPPDWEEDLPSAPRSLWRMAWMPNNIQPGQAQGCVLAVEPPRSDLGPAADDVPLRRWRGGSFSNGVDFGTSWGISICDFNHDGFIDVYANASRQLWQNLNGSDWKMVANLGAYYPNNFEYGSGWADFDNDNLPDFGSEPRGGCMALLRNLGDAVFDNVGDDPAIVDVQPCNAASETISVADVDGDEDLDWFLPTYPPQLGSSGNWFLRNNGPDANGVYTFHDASDESGLDNPPYPQINRPEGAEFCDYDYDGDVDLYSNNTIYRNLSTPGNPLFEAMTENGSGVIFSSVLDEGAGFIDYDMDGDMDLCIAFCDALRGVRMFENNGDGTFTVQPTSLFDSYNTGLCLGLSMADWDNDGDVDVTSSEVFRRNQLQETGTRHYTVATHSIPPGHITDATPAWGDWDKDGDLDSALGNWSERGRLYENYLYDSNTATADRRYVRVRVVRDSEIFDDGLETEFGAQVTVRPIGVADTNRRTRIVSTSGGYLNQNEYTLHFALPPDSAPDDPDVDLTFSVSVDLKGTSSQGFPRVDRHVNPVLGDVNFARLENREIVVYRSGRVIIDGCDFAPVHPANPLITTTGGLVVPTIDTKPPAPAASPGSDWFVGIELSTLDATAPLRVEELILDGRLDAAVDCDGPDADTFVWDVTDPANPVLAQGGRRDLATRPRNERNYVAIDASLLPGRVYRIVCRMRTYRATPVNAPVTDGEVVTNGGLFFQDATPCTGAGAAAAVVDPSNVYLAARFRPEPAGAWADLGHALAGTAGAPVLTGRGSLRPGEDTTIELTQGRPNAPLFLIFGLESHCLPLFGGVLVPAFDVILSGLSTDATGAFSITDAWPPGLFGGLAFYFQAVIVDPEAPLGYAFSNAVAGTTPY